MENPIMGLISLFIGISIVLGIAVAILNGTAGGFDCKQMQGYNNGTGLTDDKRFPAGTWAGTCHQVQEQTQQSMTLLVVILVIVAAVAILVVIRLL